LPRVGSASGLERRMKIVQVLAPAEFGGLEEVVALLAGGLVQRGSDVHVALVDRGGDAARQYGGRLAQRGVPHTLLRVSTRRYLGERRAVAALCRTHRPDIAHFHGYRCDVLGGPAARAEGIATVSTAHGFAFGGRGFKNDVYEYLQRRALRRFAAVIAVSQPIVEQLVRDGVAAHRVHLIRNAWSPRGVPLDRPAARARLGVPPEARLVGWVGRLTGEKGADVLLRAIANIPELPVSVSIVGEGTDRTALEALAQQLGIGERIRWHGIVPEAAELFPAFDVFAISSRTEGTPIVLFEAMACEVPVVSTRVGGVPDVVSDGEAILVPREDPVALAHGIRRVFADPAGANARARRARSRLETEFAPGAWLDRHDQVYQQALSVAGSR